MAKGHAKHQKGDESTLPASEVERLLALASAIATHQTLPYSWSEVEAIIRSDPKYFKIALQKAERSEYKRANAYQPAHTLWIALNLVRARQLASWCYYCGKPLNEDHYFSGGVHLEHYNPRSSGGTHAPANIVHACSKCDTLKANLSVEQRKGLWNGTIDVNALFPTWSSQARQRLLDFVDLDAPHFVGLAQYAIRHGIPLEHARAFWDRRTEAFRKRWNW